MKFEVVNTKDKTRMSRAHGKGSTTIFDTEDEAVAWMASVGLSLPKYVVSPAKESVPDV